jgi:hypothetical protein
MTEHSHTSPIGVYVPPFVVLVHRPVLAADNLLQVRVESADVCLSGAASGRCFLRAQKTMRSIGLLSLIFLLSISSSNQLV